MPASCARTSFLSSRSNICTGSPHSHFTASLPARPARLPRAELEGYLAIERRRPACGDPQHIFNKLLFDAANEAFVVHYSQVVIN